MERNGAEWSGLSRNVSMIRRLILKHNLCPMVQLIKILKCLRIERNGSLLFFLPKYRQLVNTEDKNVHKMFQFVL